MALQKSITTNSLVTAEYWMTPAVSYNKTRKEVIAQFHLYVNKAARDAGAQPVIQNAAKLVLQGSQFDVFFGATNPDAALLQKQVYVAAKSVGVISDYGAPAVVDGKHNGLRTLFSDAVDA